MIPFGAMVEFQTISARDQSKLHEFGKKVVLPWSQTLRNWKTWPRLESILEESMQKKY